jgi:anti-sigma regulatory factor (Ser/Thr protein kinase)
MVRLAAEEPCWDDGIEVLSATPDWIRLAVRCDVKTADRLLQFFHEIAEFPNAEKYDVATAPREMLPNAIEHGGRFDRNRYVEVSYLCARHMVLCRVKDPGDGFPLDEIRHAAIANPPHDPIRYQSYRDELGLRPGGLVCFLPSNLSTNSSTARRAMRSCSSSILIHSRSARPDERSPNRRGTGETDIPRQSLFPVSLDSVHTHIPSIAF